MTRRFLAIFWPLIALAALWRAWRRKPKLRTWPPPPSAEERERIARLVEKRRKTHVPPREPPKGAP